MGTALARPDPLPTISLREFMERIMDERDRLYLARFDASALSVTTALAAQEKAVAAAFLASEKAIIKAEDAQREYNTRSNEFRGQLDDQAKTLMPRIETMGLFKAAYDRMEQQREAFEKSVETLTKEVAGLRESRSEGHGNKVSTRETMSYVVTAIMLVITIVSVYLSRVH